MFVLLVGLFLFVFFPKKAAGIFPPKERLIVVFRQEVALSDQAEILARSGVESLKNLRLINARVSRLSDQQIDLLKKDRRILRIDPDVRVYALARNDRCARYPWLPWCSPTATPTPAITLTPTPTRPPASPTSTPSPSPVVTPTATPLPTSTPFPATPTPTPVSGSQPLPWGVERIKSQPAWELSTGSGVKVGIIDTGIDRDHPDLDGNLAGCVNFIYSWRNCEDDNGHGTHVAGIIAAEDNSSGVVGVAPQAKIYALKVLNRQGQGYLSDVIEALDWAVANHLQVVNLSLGTTSDVTSFREAVERVSQAGIVQVAAAGNSGPGTNTVNYPARYPQVIAVAATDINNAVPSWSSRGSEIALAAPGVAINSTYLKAGYKTLSGTSMSAPHTAGVVALRLSLFPGQTPAEIRQVLTGSADWLVPDPLLVGAGLVNALGAVSAD